VSPSHEPVALRGAVCMTFAAWRFRQGLRPAPPCTGRSPPRGSHTMIPRRSRRRRRHCGSAGRTAGSGSVAGEPVIVTQPASRVQVRVQVLSAPRPLRCARCLGRAAAGKSQAQPTLPPWWGPTPPQQSAQTLPLRATATASTTPSTDSAPITDASQMTSRNSGHHLLSMPILTNTILTAADLASRRARLA